MKHIDRMRDDSERYIMPACLVVAAIAVIFFIIAFCEAVK